MRYYYKPDAFVLVITAMSLLLLAYLWNSVGPVTDLTFWLAVLVSAFLAWFFVKMPLYTYVDEDVVRVQQVLGSTTFRRSRVTIRRLTDRDLSGMIRSFGSGGMGGYIGYFQTPQLGRFYMLAVSKSNLALVSTEEGKQFVIHYPPQN
jgi:hypothetical protein